MANAYYEGCVKGGKVGGKVIGKRLQEAAERRRLAISKGFAPDPDDDVVLAGCELGGKVSSP
jgi:hypothetical protein